MMKIDILASKLFNAECEGKQSEFRHITIQALMDTTGHTTLKTYMLYAYVDKPSETTTDKLLKAMQDISPIEI